MPFYQNVFDSEFIGTLLLGDRQLSLNFRVRGNTNSSIDIIGWTPEPYDLSSETTLRFYYSFDAGNTWTTFTVNVAAGAAVPARTLASEIVTTLNANATFAALYEASVANDGKNSRFVKIRSKRPRGSWKTYISNDGAEEILRFNKKAGVAELPSFFSRHTIDSESPDSVKMLIELDPSDLTHRTIITDAGLDYSAEREDWELLEGRSGLFTFQKITVDGSDRITEIIEYPAGAEEGDFARKITYTYTGGNTKPSEIFEIPYTLGSGDLITP